MLTAAVMLVALLLMANMQTRDVFPTYYLERQDRPVAYLALVVFAAAWVWPGGGGRRLPPRLVGAFGRVSMGVRVAAIGALLLAVCLVGHYTVMWGYAFSRDEQMVLFDAEIFARGRFAERIPEWWAPLHRALNVHYMLLAAIGTGWASNYLPVNAGLHMIAGKLATPWLANPFLTVVGLVATWRVARRILPGDNESQFVAIVLYATSTQVLALGMTSYAMTGHLTLNMVWLALFLHGRWYAHVAALAVGVLATGLHQLPFHPLFAGPVLLFCLVLRRRWAWSLFYAIGYAAALLFWVRYSLIPLGELGVAARSADADRTLFLRMMWAVQDISWQYLWTQACNLLRFVAWQNLLFLPLFVVGVREAVRRRDPLLLALAVAVIGFMLFRLVFRPYQGHGWGYRYIHGFMGAGCLLAAIGWRSLRDRQQIAVRHFAAATAATLLVATPWLLWQAHHFSGLYAQTDRAIAATDADFVIVDEYAPVFTGDLVFNPPYLDRRPIRLLAGHIGPRELERLCARGSLAFVDAEDLAPIATEFGMAPAADGGRVPPVRRAAEAHGCTIEPLAPIR